MEMSGVCLPRLLPQKKKKKKKKKKKGRVGGLGTGLITAMQPCFNSPLNVLLFLQSLLTINGANHVLAEHLQHSTHGR